MRKVDGLKGAFLACCLYCGNGDLSFVGQCRSPTSILRVLRCQCGIGYEVNSDTEEQTWYVKVSHSEGAIPNTCPECGEDTNTWLVTCSGEVAYRKCRVCGLEYSLKEDKKRLEGSWQDTRMLPDRQPGDKLSRLSVEEMLIEQQLPKALDHFGEEKPSALE